jgi:hypothetical protein
MNLNYQQLPLTNPVAGFMFSEPSLERKYEPLNRPTAGNLQREQVVTASLARVAELAVISDLRALREEERNTEAPITPRAFSVAITLLEFAHLVLDELPRTLLVPDGEGGIGIEWFREDRNVRVVIPARPEQAYIYERVGRESDIKPFSRSSAIQTLRSTILVP